MYYWFRVDSKSRVGVDCGCDTETVQFVLCDDGLGREELDKLD